MLSDGEPVCGAEVDVQFMNHDVILERNTLRTEGQLDFPSPAFETFVAQADANGVFHFAVPHAGFWGFAALDIGPVTEHQGQPLSQEAVIWVQAHELR